MSHSTYFEIYCVESNQLPPSFADIDSLEEFRTNHEARLTFDAMREDVFLTLEDCVKNLNLPAVKLFDLNRYDQKFHSSQMGELWVKRPSPMEVEAVCVDLLRLQEVAKTTPALLVFEEFQYPDIKAQYEKDISQAASAEATDLSIRDLTYYDEGEFWDHFFWVLQIVCAICNEAKMANQSLLFVWYVS